ncbi:MAG: serine/threonine protein kinase [Actinomycetota bacterium]|nr:serine/threonine protein kinase [Actinomycetota bacterium]
MAESWNLEPGDDITERFAALKVLGGGHSYEVYLAQDAHRLSLVVLKLLRPHLVDDEHEKKSLAREAAVLERLAHPVIVRSFGADVAGARPHLVLEHLEGPHLSRLIRQNGALALEQVIPLAIQIFSAAHYLEREGVVHLDIKPRNIIMGGPPRLIDLSVARSVDSALRIKSAIGTDPFMAPEQCEPARAPVGASADVWGIGATLYQSVSGRLPFPRDDDYDKDDPAQRWPQLHRVADPLPKGIPADLREVIEDCLKTDPGARPLAIEAVARLEPLVSALPSRPVLRRLRPRLGSRRR